jgi:hypothetical protein
MRRGEILGPKTKEGKECIRVAQLKHGEDTQEAKAERSTKSAIFRYLTDLGNYCNLLYKQLKTRGRPPSGYVLLDLTYPEQLALVTLKTVPKKSIYALALSLHGISHTF